MPSAPPFYAAAPTGLPRGGVVVCHEGFGVTAYIEEVCGRLADAGWYAVAPHFYHRTGAPVLGYDEVDAIKPHESALTGDGVAADVDGVLKLLLDETGLRPERCGLLGFCLGGTIATYVATRRLVGAAVCFYGGGVRHGRFPGVPPLAEVAGALRAPWLGLYGEEDDSIPAADVGALRTAAAEALVPTELVSYPGAGHAFHRTGVRHEPSATDGWHRAVDWLDRHVSRR